MNEDINDSHISTGHAKDMPLKSKRVNYLLSLHHHQCWNVTKILFEQIGNKSF